MIYCRYKELLENLPMYYYTLYYTWFMLVDLYFLYSVYEGSWMCYWPTCRRMSSSACDKIGERCFSTAPTPVDRCSRGMMSGLRFLLRSKCVHVGQRPLVCNIRSAEKQVLRLQHRRWFKSHSRNFAYAKDLFLGQVNKVRQLEMILDLWSSS